MRELIEKQTGLLSELWNKEKIDKGERLDKLTTATAYSKVKPHNKIVLFFCMKLTCSLLFSCESKSLKIKSNIATMGCLKLFTALYGN